MAERIYNAKQTYRCPHCGDRTYSLNGDNDKHFDKWLDYHNSGRCNMKQQPAIPKQGTQADAVAAWKDGKIKGTWYDYTAGRNIRFSWEEHG